MLVRLISFGTYGDYTAYVDLDEGTGVISKHYALSGWFRWMLTKPRVYYNMDCYSDIDDSIQQGKLKLTGPYSGRRVVGDDPPKSKKVF